MLHEIPSRDWYEFLDRFSNAKRGCLVSVERLFPRYASVEASRLPLESVRLRLNRKRGTQELCVHLRGNPAVEKSLQQPARVQLQRTPSGAEAALQVESESGSTLVLKFDLRERALQSDAAP